MSQHANLINSGWTLVSYDGNIGRYFKHDEITGEDKWLTTEDASKLLDLNQKAINAESGNWKGELHHVASIPPTLYMEWWKEFGGNPMSPENRPRLMKKLNDRDFQKVRVKSGAI